MQSKDQDPSSRSVVPSEQRVPFAVLYTKNPAYILVVVELQALLGDADELLAVVLLKLRKCSVGGGMRHMGVHRSCRR
jgi:hypothetical protein